jgi:hypothetical protein
VSVESRRFENVTMKGGFGHLQKGHGVSFADPDNDGDLDVYVQRSRNPGPSATGQGRTRSIYRHVNSGGSFGCNPLRQTIGIGGATAVRLVEILWPVTGETQTFRDVPFDRALRVSVGQPELVPIEIQPLELGG